MTSRPAPLEVNGYLCSAGKMRISEKIRIRRIAS